MITGFDATIISPQLGGILSPELLISLFSFDCTKSAKMSLKLFWLDLKPTAIAMATEHTPDRGGLHSSIEPEM